MKRFRPIGLHIETQLARFGFLIIPRLPRKAVVLLAKALGSISYAFGRKLKRIGMTNLQIAYGDSLDIARKKAVLHGAYRTFALILLDAFWFSRNTTKRIERYVSFDPDFDVLFKNKSHVAVSAHYGNWEILGLGVTHQGYPLHSVAKPLKNPKIDALFDQVRALNGQKIIKRKGAVRSLLRVLQDGGKIGLIMDQNTRLSEGGRFYPFFGLPAAFSTTAAALAIKTGTNIVVCAISPEPDGAYRGTHCREIDIRPYQTLELDEAVDQLTGVIVSEMEHFIRRRPEFWLWTYKRWKYIPDGDDPAKYPFYRRKAV